MPSNPHPATNAQSPVWRIEVWSRSAREPVESRIYLIQAPWTLDHAQQAATRLLADPVDDLHTITSSLDHGPLPEPPVAEIHLLPGVMDPVAMTTRNALAEAGLEPLTVRTARGIRPPACREPARLNLDQRFNPAIETLLHASAGCLQPPQAPIADQQLRRIHVSTLDDHALTDLSASMALFLDLTEMQAIAAHYRSIHREPTDIELETIAQTWSEHCVHKTLKASVRFTCNADQPNSPAPPSHYTNLVKETIFAATRTLNRPWCLSVFVDNAGVIELDHEHAVCIKVETHNRPSAIEPYGGAATGIGGCIRDVLGTGLAARPIASTNVFCVAPLDHPGPRPPGTLAPARILAGIAAGVRDYGNRMGIPTVNGAVLFHPGYLANPLVFCGCVGLIPRDKIHKQVRPGDCIVLIGGRTGRDGIHGATFSSAEIAHTTATQFASAVQIGNAITQKRMADALLEARDAGPGRSALYHAVTDCGAGGLSSAVGEMAGDLGATVQLDKVPLKYAGLRYDEIWISEAQERMVLAVPPEKLEHLQAIFQQHGVDCSHIGTFGNPQRSLQLYHRQTQVADLDCAFLHHGLPPRRVELDAAIYHQWPRFSPPPTPDDPPMAHDRIHQALLETLALPNIASKSAIWRQYDHEVQGATLVKPYVADHDAPTDAAVLRPCADKPHTIAIGCGICPELSEIDPYLMAIAAVDEAIRNVVCVGADPHHTAILDNFCWGNCSRPDRMAALVRACEGCRDAALAYQTPFISGKDSLNNEYRGPDGTQLAIPGTLLITAIARVRNPLKRILPRFSPGHPIYLIGQPAFWSAETTADQPVFSPQQAARIHHAVSDWIAEGIILACHDVSDGGLLTTLAEMTLASNASCITNALHVFDPALAHALPPTFTPLRWPLLPALLRAWPACYVVQTDQPLRLTHAASEAQIPYAGIGMATPAEPHAALVLRSGNATADLIAVWSREQLASAWAGTLHSQLADYAR